MNSLLSSFTGLSLFQCCLGYKPPLLPAQEDEVGVPSARVFICSCRRTWGRAWSALLRAQVAIKLQAHRRLSETSRYAKRTTDLSLDVGHPSEGGLSEDESLLRRSLHNRPQYA